MNCDRTIPYSILSHAATPAAGWAAGVLLLGLLSLNGWGAEGRYRPPPPVPPTPPTGLAETFYSTCGGSHPPVVYVRTYITPSDPGYRELQQYASSPEYRQYLTQLLAYKERYGADSGTYGEVDERTGEQVSSGREQPPPRTDRQHDAAENLPRTGRVIKDYNNNGKPTGSTEEMIRQLNQQQAEPETGSDLPASQPPADPEPAKPPAAPGEPAPFAGRVANGPESFLGYKSGSMVDGREEKLERGGMLGRTSGRMDRNPRQDLARWFRAFLYHQPVGPLGSGDLPAQAAYLDLPQAGPSQTLDHYAFLTRELNPKRGQRLPAPTQMLKELEQFWQAHWAPNLGLDQDPLSQTLLRNLQAAEREELGAQERVRTLERESQQDPAVARRLAAELSAAQAAAQAALEKRSQLKQVLLRREQFIRAMVGLLRLAPGNGFGEALAEVEPGTVQNAAGKILKALGPQIADHLWAGIKADYAWLSAQPAPAPGTGGPAQAHGKPTEKEQHERALKAGEELLAGTGSLGIWALCRELESARQNSPELLQRTLGYLEALIGGKVDEFAVNGVAKALPYCQDGQCAVAAKARQAVLKCLQAQEALCDKKLLVATFARLLDAQDQALAEAAESFLKRHTGQDLGRDPKAWLEWAR